MEGEGATIYVGEARYARHLKTVRNTNQNSDLKRATPPPIFTGCFNCGDLGHFALN